MRVKANYYSYKTMRMPLLLAGIFLAVNSLQAQTYTAPPVGFTTTACLANSDTLVSLPFSRPPDFVGSIASVSGGTLTISGATGWQNNQFVYGTALTAGGTQHNTYYALVGTHAVALAGTVSLTAGSNAVTGIGTTFTTAISAGDGLMLSDSSGNYIAYYIVSSVTDNTDLVLTGNARTTLSGQTASMSKSTKEGHAYLVTANSTSSGTSTVTLDTNGEDISPIVTGTLVSLVPYWTLATVFPPSDLGVSYIGTQSVRSFGTQILMPYYQGVGINISAYPIYFYSNTNSQWQMEGGSTNAGDTILLPDGYITIRNGATATSLTSMGAVSLQRLAVPLIAGSTPTSSQDNFISISRPLPVALRDLNLIASNAFTPSTSISNIKDQLFLYDNTATGINKTPPPNSDYIYIGGIWQHLGGTLGVDAGGDTIPAGAAILIRKAGSNGSTVFWTNPPTY